MQTVATAEFTKRLAIRDAMIVERRRGFLNKSNCLRSHGLVREESRIHHVDGDPMLSLGEASKVFVQFRL